MFEIKIVAASFGSVKGRPGRRPESLLNGRPARRSAPELVLVIDEHGPRAQIGPHEHMAVTVGVSDENNSLRAATCLAQSGGDVFQGHCGRITKRMLLWERDAHELLAEVL